MRDSRYKGVTLGVQSYSFRDRPLEARLPAMQKLGLTQLRAVAGSRRAARRQREELRRWRETVSLDEFHRIARAVQHGRHRAVGLQHQLPGHYTDAEIARGFEMAQGPRRPVITSSSNIETVARVAPVAARTR